MKSKSDIRMSGDYQRKVSDFVNREVLTGINELMQALMKSEDFNQGEYSEELISISGTYDYKEPAFYAVNNASTEELNEYLEYAGTPLVDDLISYITTDLDIFDIQDFCNHFNIEPHQTESLEFWVVSEYFGRQLVDHDENVQEILGLTVWGRTCSGQSISMDGVVCDIYDELRS